MQARGFSNKESKEKTLQMQIHQEVAKINGGDPLPPTPEPAIMAATALLTLSATKKMTKWMMVDNDYVASIV
jgi:hypothetical protein